MKITTNNVPRDVIEAYELTQKERKEFDYLNWDKLEKGEDSASFFRYKGNVYDLNDCERVFNMNSSFPGWDGFYSETYFSGVIFKYTDDWEQVIVGRYVI
jgi:hypothetical protein